MRAFFILLCFSAVCLLNFRVGSLNVGWFTVMATYGVYALVIGKAFKEQIRSLLIFAITGCGLLVAILACPLEVRSATNQASVVRELRNGFTRLKTEWRIGTYVSVPPTLAVTIFDTRDASPYEIPRPANILRLLACMLSLLGGLTCAALYKLFLCFAQGKRLMPLEVKQNSP